MLNNLIVLMLIFVKRFSGVVKFLRTNYTSVHFAVLLEPSFDVSELSFLKMVFVVPRECTCCLHMKFGSLFAIFSMCGLIFGFSGIWNENFVWFEGGTCVGDVISHFDF